MQCQLEREDCEKAKKAEAARGASNDEINAAAKQQIRALTAELDAAKKDAEAATGASSNEIGTGAQGKKKSNRDCRA
jgi:hypothetical protein